MIESENSVQFLLTQLENHTMHYLNFKTEIKLIFHARAFRKFAQRSSYFSVEKSISGEVFSVPFIIYQLIRVQCVLTLSLLSVQGGRNRGGDWSSYVKLGQDICIKCYICQANKIDL